MKAHLLAVCLLAVASFRLAAAADDEFECPGFCTMDYRPQCGVDNITYGNKCMAACAKVKVAYEGECAEAKPIMGIVPISTEAPVCACTREYVPVCGTDKEGNKKTFPNKCTAECELGPNSWKEGACKECVCTLEYMPVCGTDGITYGNKCGAECELGKGNWKAGECPKAPKVCACTREYVPVCGSDGVTYGNKCTAECELGPDSWKAGECPKVCRCTRELRLVCGSDGVTYSNPCMAECQLGEGSWTEGECANQNQNQAREAAASPAPAPVCRCTREYMPVCGTDKQGAKKEFPNKCVAECELGPGSWTEGTCPKVCVCTADWRPVCGSDQKTYGNKCAAECELGKGSWKEGECPKACPCTKELVPVCGSNSKTYGNKCLAECELGEGSWTAGECPKACPCTREYVPVCGKDNKSYPNKCVAECNLGPNSWKAGECPKVCACTFDYRPVCGTDGQTYGNKCAAECQLGKNNWFEGECSTLPAVDGISNCVSRVRCAKNPCDGATCPAHPTATCTPSYCDTVSFRGVELKPCQPYFTDAEGALVNCKPPVTACSACSQTYKPVCASDGKTWPNRCAAECSGLTVKKEGKCAYCKGETCKWATKNDVCTLGAKRQCWNKKYSCGLLPGTSAKAGLFGVCVPKTTKHRHLLAAAAAESQQ